MAFWTNLINALFLPGRPILGSTGIALRDNIIAITEGADGAPRLRGKAVAKITDMPVTTVTASDAYSAEIGSGPVAGTLSTTSTSYVEAQTYTIVAWTGTLRFRASHRANGTALDSWLSLLKNGAELAYWSTDSASAQARSVDVSVTPGDVIVWRHRISGSGAPSIVSAVGAFASDGYTTITPLILQSDL